MRALVLSVTLLATACGVDPGEVGGPQHQLTPTIPGKADGEQEWLRVGLGPGRRWRIDVACGECVSYDVRILIRTPACLEDIEELMALQERGEDAFLTVGQMRVESRIRGRPSPSEPQVLPIGISALRSEEPLDWDTVSGLNAFDLHSNNIYYEEFVLWIENTTSDYRTYEILAEYPMDSGSEATESPDYPISDDPLSGLL